jgi:spore coat polysaccharide biosynthesis protein SpsF
MPKTLAIIQARMASTRLPGKVLLDIVGQPMLKRVVERCRKAQTLDGIAIATTLDATDDPVERFCEQQGYPCYRGSQQDVLDRYYQAALHYGADIIVRVTGDCPVMDPDVIDSVVQVFVGEPEPAFAATRLPPPWHRTIPIGLDVEVVSFPSLERAWHEADQPFHREHVMPYFYEGTPPGILSQLSGAQSPGSPGSAQPSDANSEQPELTAPEWSIARGVSQRGFHVAVLNHLPDYGAMRWTVDTSDDLALLRTIFAAFPGRDSFTWKDTLALFQKHPDLGRINAAVRHKDFRESEIQKEIHPGEADK